MPLVRIGKRRTAWDEADPGEVARVEFRSRDGRLDLRPSVYEVDGEGIVPETGQLVRVHAEHTASFISPPRGGDDVSIDDLEKPALRKCDGETLFEFANQRHRELVFETEHDLVAFVQKLLESLEGRRTRLTRNQLFAYIAARLDLNDAEWNRALTQGETAHAKDWSDELARWRKKCAARE